ncbi:MAG TPA: tetratricopeptide repeat protein [Streptosporangiaceae bacterium]|nr:tetratricopeptide repeat protein [Streptosporangiaceae bacterium]
MTTAMIRCTQPGCDGMIEDGYCNTCGLAAPAASSAPSASAGSGSSSAPTSGSVSAGSRGTRSRARGHGSSRSSRGRLGAGLVDIPPVPYRDPASAVLADPQVPEAKRYCSSCDQPVGRGRDGRPGLAEGFCRNCGTQFSFSPKLEPGELVVGQYEVLGCLAHGGLGWIYLAKDHNVSDRWVVLKGLLNTGDADAMAAAVAERQFLAEVEHPNIVRIYNFVQHADRRTAEMAGYIVMEYVGGKSLKQILVDARQAGGSVPVSHALAYAIEVLPALGYLHDRGMVYCDFKPDNVIQTEEQLKLIDMGGVRRVDSDEAIYGTVGYQAPEIEADGPSPSSDLYTVGRALAVMTFEFRGFQGTYKHSLPDGVPLLAEQESFSRLLRRATHRDPHRRFGSATEMAEQLTGVLREVLAVGDGVPRPAFSSLFSPEVQAIGTSVELAPPDPQARATTMAPPPAAEIVAGLPLPQVDRSDPAAGYLATFAGLNPAQRIVALTLAVEGDPTIPREVTESAETRLALARARIDVGDYDAAAVVLGDLAADDPSDWRVAWYNGLRDLAAGGPGGAPIAQGAFSAVLDELPGELAPKLALAFAAEAAGDLSTAGRYFRLVWTVDRSYISAAFGMARTCLAAGDRPGAIAAFAAVPASSSHYAAAQIAAMRILVSGDRQAGVTGDDLRQAGGQLGQLALDDVRRQQLTVEILRAALDWCTSGQHASGAPILGCEPNARAVRFGLERSYRALARLTPDDARRVELVDMANAIRPRTLT